MAGTPYFQILKMFTLNLKSRPIHFVYMYTVLFSYNLTVLILKSHLPVTGNSHCFLKKTNKRSCGLHTLWLGVTSPCTVLWMQQSRFPLLSVGRGQILERASSQCLLDTVLSGINHLMEPLFSVQEAYEMDSD